jgi:hypothetical protein
VKKSPSKEKNKECFAIITGDIISVERRMKEKKNKQEEKN